MSNPFDMLGGMGGMGARWNDAASNSKCSRFKKNRSVLSSSKAGGGIVKVRVNGAMQVLSIEIDEAALQDDKEMVEDLLQVALNQALSNAQQILHRRCLL